MKGRRSLLRVLLLTLGVAALQPAVSQAACYVCKHAGGRIVIATCVAAAPNETGSSGCVAKVVPGTATMDCEFSGNFCTDMTVGGGGGGAGGGSGSGGGGACVGGPAGCPAECFTCGGGGGGGPAV